MNIEIERRWLVKTPLHFKQLKEIWKHTTSILEIKQLYRNSKKGITDRVRITDDYKSANSFEFKYTDLANYNNICPLKNTKYYHTIKKSISPGISEEEESEISEDEAEELVHRSFLDEKRIPIYKTRYNVLYKNQNFELDVFKEDLNGLAILELEVDELEQNVDLPSFLPILKEVTNDKRFKNSNLAKLRSFGEVLSFY